MVLHRQAVLGGNPNFQEIRIDRYGGFALYVDVKVGSKLEKKLLDLLQTATVNTNRADNYIRPPKSENLKWIVQRIQDRRSGW